MPSFTLYLANKNYSSWSLRAWLALKETGLPFEEKHIPLAKENTLFQIQSRSPSGRLPLLKAGEVLIWDSLAIGEYLAEIAPSARAVWPADQYQRAHARSLCAEMHSGFINLRRELPMNIRLRSPCEILSDEAQLEINRIFYAWSHCLSALNRNGPFLFGEWTLADAYFAPIHFRFQSYGIAYPSQELIDYKEAVLNRPSVKEWERAALLETDRIPKYDSTN